MEPIAQTNIQLYNQLRHQGRPAEELALVKRCYDLAVSLYTGHFQADGKPFVAHAVGVASVVAQLGVPAEIVGTACLHNIYGNGDFGDGRSHVATPRRRRVVREAVGAKVEDSIHRFRALRLTEKSLLEMSSRLDALDTRDRNLILVELGDFLEKYLDHGVLYYGDHEWVTGFVAKHGNVLVEIAQRLGYPQLGEALSDAFSATATETVPDVLRSTGGRKYIALVVPRSCRPRVEVAAIQALVGIKRKVLARR